MRWRRSSLIVPESRPDTLQVLLWMIQQDALNHVLRRARLVHEREIRRVVELVVG